MPSPSEVVYWAESTRPYFARYDINAWDFHQVAAASNHFQQMPHNGGSNATFADGHVEMMKMTALRDQVLKHNYWNGQQQN